MGSLEGRTHVAAGALAAAVACSYAVPMDTAGFLGALAVGAAGGALPDVDKAHTLAATWLPVVTLIHSRPLLTAEFAAAAALWAARYRQVEAIHPAWALVATATFAVHCLLHLGARRLLHHRGGTHSVWAVLALGAGVHLTWPGAPPWLLIAAVAGYTSHVLLDAATPEGVHLVLPLPWRLTLTGWLPRWMQQPFVTGHSVERWLVRPAVLIGVALVVLDRINPGLRGQLLTALRGG